MLISADQIGHQFAGQLPLFRNLTFRLSSGDVVALTGPSGSGKSTTLGILAGWIRPSEGRIERFGAGRTLWVFQNPHGVPRRSSLSHVMLPFLAAGLSRDEAEDSAQRILEKFGLAQLSNSLFQDLSGGEAQRLMLARAVAASPSLLLVDEPTAQLDSKSASTVIDVLGDLGMNGAAVVIATHDARVRDACDRTIDLGAF
ncbi:ABC transporter ATP-binding protein [Micromonospora inaquosa]|uniref:ABC transporter n=1 Tax=Micromonospora inaquosa TaxID=2203716 RepID=A0A3N9WEZ7_9ACTN|nr:ATP-binding cassette domain-containing protein [Micromonospora inaquosa]RQW99369.1 ABC transporter [Micromonospora inaquosa]